MSFISWFDLHLHSARSQLSTQRGIYWSLRIAIAACFTRVSLDTAHSELSLKPIGFRSSRSWAFPEWLAWRMMPLVGTMDIGMGVLTLVYPIRAVLLWAFVWGTWTALLRPLTGLGVWEFFERSGNFGAPLSMLYMCGAPWRGTLTTWLRVKALPRSLEAISITRLSWILRLTTASLLIGHGGFDVFMHKQAWVHYIGVLGIGADTLQSAWLLDVVGWFEIALAVAVLVKPMPGLLLGVVAWKPGTEFLRLPAGEPIWEFLERGGSYGAPLALFFIRRQLASREARFATTPGVPHTAASPVGSAAAM